MRIYFVNGGYNGAEDPSNHLNIWDSETGDLTSVSTNIAYDIGTGFIDRDTDGNIIVVAPRDRHWTPHDALTDAGDYWYGNANRVALSSDVVLYKLDADLQNPQPLVTDTITDYSYAEGWTYTEVATPNSGGNNIKQVFVTSTGEIVVRGQRYLDDITAGRTLHRYAPDGTLISRSTTYAGFDTAADYNPSATYLTSLEDYAQWNCYDSIRGCIYSTDGGSITRINVDTGDFVCAPAVFPTLTTQGGWTRNTVQGYIDSPDYLVQGPYPYNTSDGNPAYSYIAATDYFRSRWVDTIAVDETTGYIWALVHGYEPYGQEYALDGGTPVSSYPGGMNQPGDKWQLICINFDATFKVPGPRNMPYPRGTAAGDEAWAKVAGSHSGPPQIAADVKIIDLTHGNQHVALGVADPARSNAPGIIQYEGLTVSNPALQDPDWDTPTYVAVAPALTVGMSDHTVAGELIDFGLSLSIDTASDSTFLVKVNDLLIAAADTTVRNGRVRHDGYGTVSITPDHAVLPSLLAALAAGGATLTLVLQTGTLSVRSLRPYIYAEQPPDISSAGSSWDMTALHISRDEPGIAYYTAWVPQRDSETSPARWTTVPAVYRIDLATGRSAELFRDLRRELRDPGNTGYDDGNPMYYNRQAVFQLLVDPGGLPPVDPIPTIDPNLAAELKDLGQRFVSTTLVAP